MHQCSTGTKIINASSPPNYNQLTPIFTIIWSHILIRVAKKASGFIYWRHFHRKWQSHVWICSWSSLFNSQQWTICVHIMCVSFVWRYHFVSLRQSCCSFSMCFQVHSRQVKKFCYFLLFGGGYIFLRRNDAVFGAGERNVLEYLSSAANGVTW